MTNRKQPLDYIPPKDRLSSESLTPSDEPKLPPRWLAYFILGLVAGIILTLTTIGD